MFSADVWFSQDKKKPRVARQAESHPYPGPMLAAPERALAMELFQEAVEEVKHILL